MPEKLTEYQAIKDELAGLLPVMGWSAATQAVMGDGSLDAELVFVGEAPGATEDEQGKPFVGAAGKLLAELLASIGLSRGSVYITNVVKFRPPENRDPKPEEVESNRPFLERELTLIGPKVVVLLGRHAMRWFFPLAELKDMRGRIKQKDDTLYFTTYHPAAALYNPNLKVELQKDFKKLKALVEQIERPNNLNSPDEGTVPTQDSLF